MGEDKREDRETMREEGRQKENVGGKGEEKEKEAKNKRMSVSCCA